MHEIQKYALNHIYMASRQDTQFRFSLVQVTKPALPVRRSVVIADKTRLLPNQVDKFHVYLLGSVPVNFLNLARKTLTWSKDLWVNLEEDMNARQFIAQLYDDLGRIIPRKNVYYSVWNDGGLVFAVLEDVPLHRTYDLRRPLFVRFYSNERFTHAMNAGEVAIRCRSTVVTNNADKLALQNEVSQLEASGGLAMVYVDGLYADRVTLNIPDGSTVEYLYDASIISKEVYPIVSLTTFDSTKDDTVKYLLHRDFVVDDVQFEDDLELYITYEQDYLVHGLYYYQHVNTALTNVTDKDFALNSQFVNQQAQQLSDLTSGAFNDKSITLLTRRSTRTRRRVYNATKLHEFYKLPSHLEKVVLNSTADTVSDFRCEALENSDYFKLAAATRITDLTQELAMSAVGYDGAVYAYGQTPVATQGNPEVAIPALYRAGAVAYEYSGEGRLLRYSNASGPLHIASADAAFVEFIQGIQETAPTHLYDVDELIPLRASEYRVLAAHFDGLTPISPWEDITDLPACQYTPAGVTVSGISVSKKIRIFYFDRPYIRDYALPLVDGVLVFPLTVWEDRGPGAANHLIDHSYATLEVFLNGYRLTPQIDFFVNYPYIAICNKRYLDHSQTDQQLHIRMTGFNLDPAEINQREVSGFVTHGALTRNSKYDVSDDKVLSVFIDGQLVDRSAIRISEDDNVVRTEDLLNGLTYSLAPRMLSLRSITSLSTLPYYNEAKALDDRISALYNAIFPEPEVHAPVVIANKHYLYSITLTKILYDLLDGNIPSELYTRAYDDTVIHGLLTDQYALEFGLEPIRANLPEHFVEIHPHPLLTPIQVNLHQYRFIANVARILTADTPVKLNLTDYLTITTETVPVNPDNGPGGIVVL